MMCFFFGEFNYGKRREVWYGNGRGSVLVDLHYGRRGNSCFFAHLHHSLIHCFQLDFGWMDKVRVRELRERHGSFDIDATKFNGESIGPMDGSFLKSSFLSLSLSFSVVEGDLNLIFTTKENCTATSISATTYSIFTSTEEKTLIRSGTSIIQNIGEQNLKVGGYVKSGSHVVEWMDDRSDGFPFEEQE
ncbi:hypothetical protein VNO77_41866 [Canavalia gladiata]|uniref:Uncharacterized protein n=1 Tax=Canavalia gladiata TaxID=3824 RepID=A0AAN9K1B8_CANGL